MKRFLATLLLSGSLAGALAALPVEASAEVSVGISVNFGPPLLPYYPQPICPGVGFIWVPGYWAYDADDYFWVPGTWVLAPAVGLLWTPGYWGWEGGLYWWHPGYWAPHVGFYGGINYGYGYAGVGYAGGYWESGAFYYNRAVTNVNVEIVHNSYNEPVAANLSHVSYNGGTGGIRAVPTEEQRYFADEHRIPATTEQMQHERTAFATPGQHFSQNRGKPAFTATVQPGRFEENRGSNAVRQTLDRSEGNERNGRANPASPAASAPAEMQKSRVNNAANPRTNEGERSDREGRANPASPAYPVARPIMQPGYPAPVNQGQSQPRPKPEPKRKGNHPPRGG